MNWVVTGWKKLLRNYTNLLDIVFIVVNTSYFVLRIKDQLLDGHEDTGLPNLTSNNKPTFMMFYNLLMTSSIVSLIAVKLLLYMRVNEEYGMLSELVFATI